MITHDEGMAMRSGQPLNIQCLIMTPERSQKKEQLHLYHYHKYIELLYMLSGEMEVYIYDESYHCQCGDLIIVYSKEPHAFRYLTDCRYIVIKLLPEILTTFGQSLNEFEYMRGCTFQASHFSDVASNWGIGFTIWKVGETSDKNNFPHELVDYRDLDVEVIGHKDIYNVDGMVSASDWAKESIKKLKTHQHVPMTSGVLWQGDNKDNRGAIFDNAIGYLLNNANKVENNTQLVALFSTTFGAGHGHGLNESNFTRCTALFTARRVIKGDWVNDKDEYIAPNETHPKYKEFENDSIIYSLFDTASNQSSLRNITYRHNQYDIKNEFFFMKKDDILTLADENGYDHTYDDCKSSSERYVADLLFNKGLYKNLSPEAKEVLDKAIDMTRNTFSRREQFDDENSKYQIMNWDCGYYQLKELWKVYCPNDFKEFRLSFKRLQDKLIPMVYELGFLKK